MKRTIEVRVERRISAPPNDVYEAWLNPKTPGTPWNAAEKFVLDAKVDGLFFWHLKGTSHYGRFIELQRARRLRHTWVSPSTDGEESTVTVTFQPAGDGTLMTLVHSNLPDHERARGHEKGWNSFLGVFGEQFGAGSRKEYRWEEAHSSTKA